MDLRAKNLLNRHPGTEAAGAASDCPTNRHKSLNDMASSLGVVNIGGIFVVLLCGLALAFVVAILEFCCRRDTKTAVVVFPAEKDKKGGEKDQGGNSMYTLGNFFGDFFQLAVHIVISHSSNSCIWPLSRIILGPFFKSIELPPSVPRPPVHIVRPRPRKRKSPPRR